jgi:hypothetical protein
MVDYTQKEEEYDFSSLVEDDTFKSDLVKFFSGGRYNYSVEEMREKGFEGLAEDFVTHMRYQSWNEVEAVRDLNYVRQKDMHPEGKKAFGRLMQAWDNSDSAGQGFGDSVSDFAGAVISAPSTYIGLGSFGLGKLGAKAATKATQVAVRYGLKQHLKKNVVQTGVKRTAAQQAYKEAGTGFVTGAGLGALQAGAQGETREEVIEGYEYDTKDLIFDATVGGVTEGTVGAGLGYLSGVVGRGTRKKVDDILLERGEVLKAERQKATAEALKVIKGADPAQARGAKKIVADLEEVLSARAGVKGAGLKDPLDPDRVAKGRAILNSLTDPNADPIFASGLSADTMRKIAAASIDLMNNSELKTKEGDRITQSIADAIRNDETGEVFKFLENTRAKYGLSKDEFSLIYLAEVSRAGQTLGFASAVKRGANLAGVDELFSKGASSMSSDEMAIIGKEAIRRGATKGKAVGFLQDLDAMRIAFMTSQPVTTMRNLRNSGILVATDILDETNRALYKGLTGDPKAIKDFIPNATAILRGYSTNNAEAKVIREILFEEGGEQYKRLFNDAMRIDVGLEGQSVMAKAGRFVNTFNTVTDSVLKEGMFYGALDRQFREKYDSSLKDWLRANKSLNDIPENINVDEAIEVANRFTMQRTFRDDDSTIAKATKGLVDLNRRMPFLVSEGLGVPFPRYVGNHLQMVAEYTPILGEIMQQTGIASKTEDASLRYARQMTGAMMLFGGYQVADMRGGEADYGTLKNTIFNSEGMTEDMKAYAGSALAHMYVGDIVWRRANGLPAEIVKEDLADILGGIPDFSFDLAIGRELLSFAKTGDTEGLEKEIGNILSTFTYPGVIARDMYGQLDPDSAGAAYVRDLALTSDVNTKGTSMSGSGVLVGQTTRMLMDSDMLQYTQSFNGENDIQYYRFSNPVAIATINPALKQVFGSSDEPAMTGLEEEMSKMNIKDWQIYNKRTVPNANVDILLRRRLARGNPDTGAPSLANEFDQWRKGAAASPRFGSMTYDEIIASDDVPASEKKEILEGWIKKRITQERESMEGMFNSYVANSPLKARGFIRNNYSIIRKREGAHVFDLAAKKMGFESADDMITSSDNVQQEISRRLSLLSVVPTLAPIKPK